MAVATFTEMNLSDVPTGLWWLGLVAMLIAVGSGFAAGFYYARWLSDRTFRRARSGMTMLFQTILATLESAQEVCSLLEKYPGRVLQPEQTEQLIEKRNTLMATISGFVKRQTAASDPEADVEQAKPQQRAEKFVVQWQAEPADSLTGLPNREAFETNLTALLEAGRQAERDSGLLLVKVDKLDTLRNRLGSQDTETLLRKLVSVICRSVRDEDLVCRNGDDTLSVLFPNTDVEAGRKLASAIRDSVRSYHFRVEEHGPEVFLTASFGYTICRPEDNVDLALNRSGDALNRSQRLGRNQLHTHDGKSMTRCLAS